MDSFLQLLQGFENAVTWVNLLYCFLGVAAGMLVGIMPGLGPAAGTAILLSITFGMDSIPSIILLAGIFYGAMYGGTITSVLINLPGEAASVITCLDGHQMAKQGRAGTALGIAALGSFIGGTVAIIGLSLIGPPLAQFALRFGPPEFFSLMLFALMTLVTLMGKSLLKGIISATTGLLLSLIGIDPMTGTIRFTFNQIHLMNGFDFVVVVMGLFGISEILLSIENMSQQNTIPEIKGLFPKRKEWKPSLAAILRGTGIGFFLGLIPGANAVIASLISYSTEKKLAKDPSRFGKGAIEGVAGPETANNAFSGAALIPLFTLGLPTSPTVAVLMGAFIMHGLTPGPHLFQSNPDFVWTVIASMFLGNLMLLIMNLPLAGIWAKVALIPYKVLFPLILIISCVGAYSINNSLWDIGVMIVFGIIGYVMKKMEFPLAPMILTFILGKSIESNLIRSLKISESGFLIFFQRPLSAILLGITLAMLVFGTIGFVKNKRNLLADDVEN
ncbi:hypothetical protein MHOCP_03060 [Moorella humiferrea]|uniref:tripartite tricarboxylate transporter permease n=1 Tax=Neomoorella humiferrea TaxID=676965 RepID=UPI0030D1F699